MTGFSADVAVIGGGTGGVAAALAAARAGATVVLTEQYAWIGGQLTSQAVPPDEHPWIEQFGATASYREYRRRVREYYRAWYPLSERAREAEFLNPGWGSVSAICHEPRVGLAVLHSMLAPHLAAGRIRILTRHEPVRAEVDGDRVVVVSVRDLETGAEVEIRAPYILDATETGDLLPLAGVEYVTGTESRAETGEEAAPEVGDPQKMQSFTVCFAMDHLEGEDHTIERPDEYDFWTGPDAPVRQGPQIGWAVEPEPGRTLRPNPDAATDADVVVSASWQGRFDPPPGYQSIEDQWRFRRILSRANFDPELRSDVSLVNWPANDYIAGSIVDVSPEDAAANLHAAKQQSLSLLYWLQTEAPRPDGGTGFRGLRPRGDLTGTADGLAMAPYIREGRRIKARTTVVHQDIAMSARGDRGVRVFEDSVGVGSYKIDLHPSTNGGERRYDPAWPFEIPLGALLPQRVTNLLAAAKNLGTTHLTNGCYRVHPAEWNIGESAGALAAYCVRRGVEPAAVHERAELLRDFQGELERHGVELHWPDDVRAY
ncbi:MAG: FAD-dependent oxidoreductase [Microbacterium sp.]|nr:FAD-dependent oxidoreductase [Microbacterium sp.]